MAEPMVIEVCPAGEEEEQTSREWEDLLPVVDPRTFVEIYHRRDAYLTTGEFFCLAEPVKIACDATSIGRGEVVVTATVARILAVEQNPTKVVANFLVPASEYPQFPANDPVPPNDRTYLEYPPELVWTDTVQRLPPSQVKSEAFVFKFNWIRTGEGSICLGMTNGFLVRIRHQRLSYSWQAIPSHNTGFQPFPHSDSYSKRAWDNVVRLSRLISYELGRSSITQSSRQSRLIDYSLADWIYLRHRLYIPNSDFFIEKEGVSTLLFIRRNGTKEVLKCIVTKQSYRLDTSPLFDHLTGVLGTAIRIGLRLPSPRAPQMSKGGRLAHGSQRASAFDSFNLFHPLPEASVDGKDYRPRHRGVDFHYDTLKSKLRVSLRFRRAHPGDATVRTIFGLGPLLVGEENDDDEDSDGEHSSSETVAEEEAVADPDPTTINLVVGDLVGTDDYLLQVRRILSQRSHVVVVVLESDNPDFVVRSERVLTMIETQTLYVQYNNL
jgi:hypothetical protein